MVHPIPRFLVLTGSEILNTFVDGKAADLDIVDAAIRRFSQLDVTAESGGYPVRWRHFLESDFAVLHEYFHQNIYALTLTTSVCFHCV